MNRAAELRFVVNKVKNLVMCASVVRQDVDFWPIYNSFHNFQIQFRRTEL